MLGIPEWAMGVGFIILAGSAARGLIGRLLPPSPGRGRRGSRRELAGTVEDLQGKLGGLDEVQAKLDELEDVQRRLADVEERLDFAERVIAQRRTAGTLEQPKKT